MTDTDRPFARIAAYIAKTAWAVHPSTLLLMTAILSERRGGHRPSEEEIRRRVGVREVRDDTPDQPGVRVIPINGPIVPKADLFESLSSGGGTSIEKLQAAFRAAVASPGVSAIVFDIDSPGGSAELVSEMASEIMNARGSKPIVAVANAFAASAAYWIGSAADELVVSPSSQVGSIGVWSAHQDVSAAMEQKGIKHTIVSAGEYKTEGNPYEPLGDEARAEMQRTVDAYYDMFVAAIAEQRGVSVAKVESDFGQGRMVMAQDAVRAGMADRVGTLQETISRLAPAPVPSVRASTRSASMETRAVDGTTAKLGFDAVGRTLHGYAIVFGQWAEFDSPQHGRIRERWMRGSTAKTIAERRDQIKVLFNHGKDHQAGQRPLGPLAVLREDSYGLYYECPLSDTRFNNEDLLPLLRDGAVNANSVNMLVLDDAWEYRTSDGIPERTIREVMLAEIGPAVFPVFEGANAGVRSMPDAVGTSQGADPTDPSAGATSEDAAVTSAIAAAQARGRQLELMKRG
jgi:HK97 family phage prohead protease